MIKKFKRDFKTLDTALIIPILKKYFKKEITKKECIMNIVKLTGAKAVRVAGLLALLSFSITAIPTSTYLIAKYSMMVAKTLKIDKRRSGYKTLDFK